MNSKADQEKSGAHLHLVKVFQPFLKTKLNSTANYDCRKMSQQAMRQR